jgi:hypothetical protein
MLLRVIGMLFVVVIPSLFPSASTAQIFRRGRVTSRFVVRSRTCATQNCYQTTACATPRCRTSRCVTSTCTAMPAVVQEGVVQAVSVVSPTTVVEPTCCVQAAGCVQSGCAIRTRTVQRTRIRTTGRVCCTSPCVMTGCVTPCATCCDSPCAAPCASALPCATSAPCVASCPTPVVVVDPVVVPSELTSVNAGPVVIVPSMVQTNCCASPVSFVQRTTCVQRTSFAGGGVMDALAIVNQRRAARGLYPLSYDPALATAAQRKSQNRAQRRRSGHDGTNKGGARAEGVGMASGGGDLSSRFHTCHMYSRGYRRAGAAVAYDGRGSAYFTLLLR